MSEDDAGRQVPATRQPMRPTVYPSGVDTWIAAMLGFTPILAAGIGVYLMMIGKPDDAAILFLSGVATLLVTAAFTVPCRYTMTEDALAVRCGIIGYRIPLEQIDRVEKSRTILSGPALSMDRVLVITKSNRKHILSPRERDAFIQDVQAVVDRHPAQD